MTTIQEVVNDLLQDKTLVEVGDILGISYSMVSRYKKDFMPSIEVAKRWYIRTGVALHPFAGESLIKEIENG